MVEISRKLKQRHVFTLAFGSMIGWSWILLTGEWIARAGILGAALAIIAGGTLMALIATVYAELASMFPTNGGEHVYTMKVFGSTVSFICGWSLLLGYMGVVAFEIVVFPFVLAYLFPAINVGFLWNFEGYNVYLGQIIIGISTAVIITFINVRGIASSARLQANVTLLILLAGFILVVGTAKQETWAEVPGFLDSIGPGVFSVLIMLPMLFVGFDIIAQTAQEIDLKPQQIGRLIIVSVICATIFYALAVISVGLVLGESASYVKFPTALAAKQGWNGKEWAKHLVIFGGIAGILTSWNGFLVGASRLIYEMSKDGQLPAWLARGSHGNKAFAPIRVLWVLCAISCIAPWFGRSTLIWFLDAGSLGVVVAYFFVVLVFIKLRYTEPDRQRPYRAPFGKVLGLLALASTLFIGTLYFPGSPSALLWPQEWIIVVAWTAAGCFGFWLAKYEGREISN